MKDRESRWCATFYATGMEHSPVAATGTAWERTPWQATQWAAWEALTNGVAGLVPRLPTPLGRSRLNRLFARFQVVVSEAQAV